MTPPRSQLRCQLVIWDLIASNQVQCKRRGHFNTTAMVKGIVLAKGPFVPKGQVVMHMPTDANRCVKSTAQHFHRYVFFGLCIFRHNANWALQPLSKSASQLGIYLCQTITELHISRKPTDGIDRKLFLGGSDRHQGSTVVQAGIL